MGHILLHAYLCLAQQTFLHVDTVADRVYGEAYIGKGIDEGESELHSEVALHLLGGANLETGAALHEYGVVIHLIDIAGVVATKLLVDGLVERWQIGCVAYLTAVVLYQCCECLTVESLIP